jgi:Fur family peroxide stress response transcriptional regulator
MYYITVYLYLRSTHEIVQMDKLNQFIEVLHENGFKATPQRIEILNILTKSHTHPTVDEVYQKVKKKFPTISPATVYKTIQALKEARKVQELPFYDDKTRLDANMEPHVNLVCLKCEKITDLINPKVKEFVKNQSEKASFKMEGQRIDFYGICEECQ